MDRHRRGRREQRRRDGNPPSGGDTGREWGGQRGKRWKKWGFITFGGVPRSHAVLGSLQLAAERAVSCLSRRIPYDSIGVREESAMTRFEIE